MANDGNLTAIEEKYLFYGPPNLDFGFWIYFIYSNILCISGCGGYALVCWVIIRFKNTTFNNAFYTLALSLALPDVVVLILHIFYTTPVAILGESRVPRFLVYMSGFLEDVSFWSLASHILVICFNRLIAVIWFKDYQNFFTTRKLAVMIIGCYVVGFAMPAIMYGCSCIYHIPSGFGWEFTCGGGCGRSALYLNEVLCMLLVVTVGAVYCIIFLRVRDVNRKIASRVTEKNLLKKERAMVLQFSLVVLVLAVYLGGFWSLEPLIKNGIIRPKLGMAVLNTFVLLNSSINPFLYMTFGSDIQRVLRSQKSVSKSQRTDTNEMELVHKPVEVEEIV